LLELDLINASLMGILVNNKNTPSPAKLEEAIRLFSAGEKNIYDFSWVHSDTECNPQKSGTSCIPDCFRIRQPNELQRILA
jgi:hypothetical protein